MLKQRTLRNSIKASGIGLHSGKQVNIELHPADANTGIRFVRTDLNHILKFMLLQEKLVSQHYLQR